MCSPPIVAFHSSVCEIGGDRLKEQDNYMHLTNLVWAHAVLALCSTSRCPPNFPE
jgi:hypothetical protein